MCTKNPATQGEKKILKHLKNLKYFKISCLTKLCRCKGLMLLETYSSLDGEKLLNCLPKFLNIVKEVTGDPSFSMFNLSLKEDWSKTKKFCHSLHGKDQRLDQAKNHYGRDEVQRNGIAQLNNHNDSKVCCEQNNHENHAHSNDSRTSNDQTHKNVTSNSPN